MDPSTLMQMFGQGGGNNGYMSSSGFGGGSNGGFEQFLSGLFGGSDKPYKEAGKTLEDYLRQGKDVQNPFLEAGTGAIPKFQEWLNGMKDPSGFINNLMGKYSESPWAKYQQEQAMRAAGNQGSASGMSGSTPMGQFLQQNARDISSQDMDKWLQNVLGINTQYGAGQHSLIQGGQHAADSISDLLKSFGGDIAKAKFGEQSERNQNRNNMIGGAYNMFKRGIFG